MASSSRRKPLRRWELHWADVPPQHSVGREQRNSDDARNQAGRVRPWLIVSDPRIQQGGVVVAVPLTSVDKRADDAGLQDFRVRIPAGEITQAPDDIGTPVDTVALCDHVRSMAVERFHPPSRLGKLKNSFAPFIELALRDVLGLDDG